MKCYQCEKEATQARRAGAGFPDDDIEVCDKHAAIIDAEREGIVTIGNRRYPVDKTTGRILNAGAFCFDGRHFGHPYCTEAPDGFKQAEAEGQISRHFDGAWYWYV